MLPFAANLYHLVKYSHEQEFLCTYYTKSYVFHVLVVKPANTNNAHKNKVN